MMNDLIGNSKIENLIEAIISKNPKQKAFVKASLNSLEQSEANLFQRFICYYLDQGHTIEQLAQSYNTVVYDTMSEQIYFRKHRKYRHTKFSDVAEDVYNNDKYMHDYMLGLNLTQFLWKNHLELLRFFQKTLPKSVSGRYLEVGPGHGVHLMHAIAHSQYSEFLGIDISKTSVRLCQNLLNSGHFGNFSTYEIFQQDFLTFSLDQKFDAIVMGEVLEHVEQPELFLRKIHDLAHSKTYIYVTTCINAPAIDHIYLFSKNSEIVEMINEAGLSVIEEAIIPYERISYEECIEKKLPINVGYVLGKQ